jgi:hypothetical protein
MKRTSSIRKYIYLFSIILEIRSDKEIEFRWKEIQDEYKRLNTELNVVYLRFNKDNGHIGLFKNRDEELTFIKEFILNNTNFTVKKCEGDNLIDFWKIHGGHFELCIGKGKGDDRKKGRGKKGKRDPNYLKSPVTLAGETYNLINHSFTDLGKIKGRTRKIFSSTKDEQKITGNDHEFLVDLLKYHRNADEKLKELDYFTVLKHCEHTYSRCFYIIRKDGSKEVKDN